MSAIGHSNNSICFRQITKVFAIQGVPVSSEFKTFSARWVFPATRPPLYRGTITVCGETIHAVESYGNFTPDVDFGNSAIIPGMVNPHTHLDLSGARGLIPPTDPDHFVDWLRGVINYRRTRSVEQIQNDIELGLAECLTFGTTLIGDIALDGASWDVLAAASTRAVVFRELIGLGVETGQEAYCNAKAWLESRPFSRTCRAGLSPHAPYSVHKSLLALAGNLSRDAKIPYAVHLAESYAEFELLYQRQGPFINFLKDFTTWQPDDLVDGYEDFFKRCHFDQTELFIHCNYLSSQMQIPMNATIVYCPRTHAAFKHPHHPFREISDRGVRVCLGTDSLASNPDLDILAEARFVREQYPGFRGDSLLRMCTISGAEALNCENETGSLEPGKSADFVVVPLHNQDAADPHELLFSQQPTIEKRQTLFRGVWRN